jgi:hypothetical protein
MAENKSAKRSIETGCIVIVLCMKVSAEIEEQASIILNAEPAFSALSKSDAKIEYFVHHGYQK